MYKSYKYDYNFYVKFLMLLNRLSLMLTAIRLVVNYDSNLIFLNNYFMGSSKIVNLSIS